METPEKINPYRWAQENLSTNRALAFKRALRELEADKWSDEHKAEYRKSEEIRIAFAKSNREVTDQLEKNAYEAADALEKQAHELLNKARDIRNDIREKISELNAKVYDTEEYKAQQEKVRELWRKDDEVFQPKVQALMDKYLKAQNQTQTEKVGA